MFDVSEYATLEVHCGPYISMPFDPSHVTVFAFCSEKVTLHFSKGHVPILHACVHC